MRAASRAQKSHFLTSALKVNKWLARASYKNPDLHKHFDRQNSWEIVFSIISYWSILSVLHTESFFSQGEEEPLSFPGLIFRFFVSPGFCNTFLFHCRRPTVSVWRRQRDFRGWIRTDFNACTDTLFGAQFLREHAKTLGFGVKCTLSPWRAKL